MMLNSYSTRDKIDSFPQKSRFTFKLAEFGCVKKDKTNTLFSVAVLVYIGGKIGG